MEETELPAERPPEMEPDEDDQETGGPVPDTGADEMPPSESEDVQGDDDLDVNRP